MDGFHNFRHADSSKTFSRRFTNTIFIMFWNFPTMFMYEWSCPKLYTRFPDKNSFKYFLYLGEFIERMVKHIKVRVSPFMGFWFYLNLFILHFYYLTYNTERKFLVSMV